MIDDAAHMEGKTSRVEINRAHAVKPGFCRSFSPTGS
jgi:hypothetical protein